jgi:hypothetical protein
MSHNYLVIFLFILVITILWFTNLLYALEGIGSEKLPYRILLDYSEFFSNDHLIYGYSVNDPIGIVKCYVIPK